MSVPPHGSCEPVAWPSRSNIQRDQREHDGITRFRPLPRTQEERPEGAWTGRLAVVVPSNAWLHHSRATLLAPPAWEAHLAHRNGEPAFSPKTRGQHWPTPRCVTNHLLLARGNMRQPHDDCRFTCLPLRCARNRCPSRPRLKTSVGRLHRNANINQW
jgi:hypothetical protein